MNRRRIPCKVRDEYILGSGGVIGAEGSGDDVALELEFGERWEGLVKYVTFRNALGEDPETVLVTADLMELRELPHRSGCPRPSHSQGEGSEAQEVRAVYLVPVPAKAKAVAGEMSVTVRGFAVSGDGTETEAALVAATAYFRVLPGKWALPGTEGFSPPTVAQRLQAEIERIQGDIVAAAQAADAKEAARQSAGEALQSAQAAREARSGVEEALKGARSALAGAESARDAVRADRVGAQEARAEAESARIEAQAALVGAQSAGKEAEAAAAVCRDAREGAENARVGALAAREEAQTARAETEASALSARESAQKAIGEAESSLEQAERAKREADRAQAVAGGDFVTTPELDLALANQGFAPLVGPAELVGELLPGGVLFITDEGVPEDYAVTLEQLLAEGDKAYAGQGDALGTLLTVGVTRVLGLRADGAGSEYTLATLPSLGEDIRALCAEAQAGGSYVLDGKTAVSHRQVQYYILHKSLVSHSQASRENWGWMGDVRTELQAMRWEIAQLRAMWGDINAMLDEINGEAV